MGGIFRFLRRLITRHREPEAASCSERDDPSSLLIVPLSAGTPSPNDVAVLRGRTSSAITADAVVSTSSSGRVTRWPATVLFRWKEKSGPRDAWDTFPFPQGGSGVYGRLRAAAFSSTLFQSARGEGRVPALSVELSVGGASRVLLLQTDKDVEKAVQLLSQLYPATASVFVIVVRGGAAEVSQTPLPLLSGGVGPRPPSPAPVAGAAPENALPIDAWTCILNVLTCRCVCVGGGGGAWRREGEECVWGRCMWGAVHFFRLPFPRAPSILWLV